MSTLYTLQKARKNGDLFGPSHGADHDGMTLCGCEIDDNWWITNNSFDGNITCKKCLAVLDEFPTLHERINHVYDY